MSNVIVVPEKSEFWEDLFQGEVIYINENLGEPQLESRGVRYIAPYLLDADRVFRVYHISEIRYVKPSYEIYLGNSFLVQNEWRNMGQTRRFEYHRLSDFGFVEQRPGFLLPI